ncbi:MAG: Ig-like domain-containing protein [Granulosicoccus sp.]
MRTRDIKVMDKKYLGMLLVAGSVALTSCGQRTDDSSIDGQTTFGANGETTSGIPGLGAATPETLNLNVISDANSISTGGTDVANLVALVTNGDRNAVAAQNVTFSSTGGVLQNVSGTTDENGEARATLSLPQDFQNQAITITVSAESFTDTIQITASGSQLDVSGPETLVLGDSAELVMRLTAGNGEPISNQVISVTSTAGNSIVPAVATTDPDGRVSVSIGTENSSDTIEVTALNGTVRESHSFVVAADVLQFADGVRDSEIPVAAVNDILVTWTSQGAPTAGQDLRFSTTAGEIVGNSTIRTNLAGQATVQIRSGSAGPAKITVEAANTGTPKTSIDVEFVATQPSQLEIDASSTRVHTNETSTIMALITDANGNPVKNQDVDFTSSDLKGGQLNPASAKTNSAGIASVSFTAGENATQVDDIVVVAQVKNTSINDELNLTVVKRVLNVTIGTSNEVIIKPLGTQYAMPFLVQVADGSGNPLQDATVKLSIRPLTYGKGRMTLVNEAGQEFSSSIENWTADSWAIQGDSITCLSEDANGNRILDADDLTTEDYNGNGSLDPQDPASLAAVDGDEYATLSGGSLTTDNNGSGFFEMIYPASNSLWAYVEITARAEALGAEADDSFRTVLFLPSSETNDKDNTTANYLSPYGTDVRLLDGLDGIDGCSTTF